MIRALVADDEPLARRKLKDLLAETEGIECIGEASDGETAVEQIETLRPDLVFLDIKMPGATGLEVLERLERKPHVIFTTAFDKYAVTAFELQAVDYLLKPFGPRRFQLAVERARQALAEADPEAASTAERARDALDDSEGQITRLFVRQRGRIIPLAVDDIQWLEARDDYVALHVGGRRHLVHVRLKEFEMRLDPDRFIRIHRSHIVNLDHVAALEPYEGSRLQVRLKDGATVIASRNWSKTLRRIAL